MENSKPVRKRKAANLTLSEEAKIKGNLLAEHRGIRLSQLVEQLLRAELERAKLIEPIEPK